MESTTTDWGNEPIAVVGLACRFAGEAKNPNKLWDLLAEGRSAWSEIPSSRFNLEGSYHPDPDKLSTVSLTDPSCLLCTMLTTVRLTSRVVTF